MRNYVVDALGRKHPPVVLAKVIDRERVCSQKRFRCLLPLPSIAPLSSGRTFGRCLFGARIAS